MPESDEDKITDMFNHISPTYDKVNNILSFGMDHKWRKALLKNIPDKANQKLLDIATGTGEIVIRALKSKRIRKATGLDLAEDMLKIAKSKAKKYKTAQFVCGNALQLPFEKSSFDIVTMGFGIRNVQNIEKALSEIFRVLKPKGRVLILEFSLPRNILLKKVYLIYLRHFLPKIGGFFSKSKASYRYLNQTIESFPHGEQFLKYVKEAGFKKAEAIPLMGGVVSLYKGDKC